MRLFKRYTTLVLLTLALLASSARSGNPHHRTALPIAARESSELLSPRDRVEVFEEVWETINEKYYDASFNGVDWPALRERYRPLIERASTDDEFYGILKRMVGELHDAHTRFHTPEERRERERLQAVSAGISIYEVEGKPVIASVEPGSDA